MNDITFETKIDFGNFGGNKKLTFTSWNGNAPRYDIRDWFDDKVGKGITLDKDELKSLYKILIDMFTEDRYRDADFDGGTYITTEEVEETTETIEDTSLMSQLPFGLDNDTEETTEEVEEETEEYPKEIQLIFNELDKLFKNFNVEKAYGKMPFADGERLQYFVTKDKKEFDIKENTLKKLGVNWFITDKGNLYIYTL